MGVEQGFAEWYAEDHMLLRPPLGSVMFILTKIINLVSFEWSNSITNISEESYIESVFNFNFIFQLWPQCGVCEAHLHQDYKPCVILAILVT